MVDQLGRNWDSRFIIPQRITTTVNEKHCTIVFESVRKENGEDKVFMDRLFLSKDQALSLVHEIAWKFFPGCATETLMKFAENSNQQPKPENES